MPPIVLTIISIINLAAKAGPVAATLYEEAQKLFGMLAGGGLITTAQQNALMTWADEHQKATLAGIVPPELQVEPDPE